jgi:hypothetical protein
MYESLDPLSYSLIVLCCSAKLNSAKFCLSSKINFTIIFSHLDIRDSLQKFQKYINNTITSYLDLILHHRIQSSPLGSARTEPSVSATFERHSGSISLLG